MRLVTVVLVVAALAAGLTALLAKVWLDRQAAGRARPEAPALVEVLVAAREIPAGVALAAADLRYDGWPAAAVTPRLLVRRAGDDPKAQFIGQTVRRPLAEGEPFSAAATFRPDGSGVLAGLLMPGMRAVSIAITNSSAVSGFITPGDRVDIVLAADLQRATEGDRQQGGGGSAFMLRYVAETVLTDIKVLAIDQQIARGRDGGAQQGKTATVEVSPKQAELLSAAGMLGSLQLVLRGLQSATPAAAPTEPDPGFTSDAEASKALQVMLGARSMSNKRERSGGTSVQINRAGQVTSEGFAR